MKICAISDLHGNLPEIPECELLLIAGDICPATNHRVDFQRKWLQSTFDPWLNNIFNTTGCNEIIGICGNHDFVGQQEGGYYLRQLNWTYLDDEQYEYKGLKIWGCPHTKTFFNWAFMMDPTELALHHSRIPPKMDIIVTHGPPYGFGDAVPRGNDLEHTGSQALLDYIVEQEPKLVAFGHIHCGSGVRTLGNTTIANVTLVDESYRMSYPPRVFEV